jgi:hypothetical protein
MPKSAQPRGPLSKPKHGKQSPRGRQARPRARRTLAVAASVVLAVALLAAAALILRGARGGAVFPPASSTVQGSAATVTAAAASADFRTLNGRWLRPDGGYILDIQSVDPGGKIDAAYFNPRPINVATAQATRDGSTLKVFVELRAPDYPESTYTLTYHSERDQLEGTYFHAGLQQTFDVGFVRMK